MTKLYIDFETLSSLGIKEAGGDAYARHHSTATLCLAFALGKEPVRVYVPPFEQRRAMGIEGAKFEVVDSVPENILDHIRNGGDVCAHNAAFDAAIWNHEFLVKIAPTQIDCTMARACAMALPASLDMLGEVLGLSQKKDKSGSKLIKTMCCPPFITSKTLLGELANYCGQDVEVLRAIDGKLLPLTELERKVWQVNYIVNDRGLLLDVALIHECNRLAAQADIRLGEMAQSIAGLDLKTLRSPKQIKEWAESPGVMIEDMANIPEHDNPIVKQILDIRDQVCKTSIKKFDSMLEHLCADGRARGSHVYHKATTGRFAGSGIQVQNIARPAISDPDSAADYVVKHGSLPDGLGVDDKTALSSLLRSCIIAPEGKEFYCGDFASIESKVLFWCAGEKKGLDVYAKGEDLYCVTASAIFNRPVTKADKFERSVGKVVILACGYQGGVSAFSKMAETLGVDLSKIDPKAIVEAYRSTYPKVKNLWGDCEQAAISAIDAPGACYLAGRCSFKYNSRYKALGAQLPSGRWIMWPSARIDEEGITPWGSKARQIAYMGTNLAHKWAEKKTYAGDIAQSLVQGIARDMLTNAMIKLEVAGFPVVLHVHDEIMVEVEEGLNRFEDFKTIMSTPAPWALVFPLSSEGWIGRRYQK